MGVTVVKHSIRTGGGGGGGQVRNGVAKCHNSLILYFYGKSCLTCVIRSRALSKTCVSSLASLYPEKSSSYISDSKLI